MTAKVNIFEGTYRGNDVRGTFTLLKNWKEGAKGGFVTVLDEDGVISGEVGKSVRVKCGEADFEYANGPLVDTSEGTVELQYSETDEETMARLEKTFGFIPLMTNAAQKGQITALIISGPGGVGKSYGVEQELQKMNLTRTLAGKAERYTLVTGGCSTIGLYKLLWDNRKKGDVVVFDDCDTVLWDEASLNMLKAALDTKPKRKICWMTESRVLEREDIPNDFVFEGSVIFLTNLKFDGIRSQKIAAHLQAIMSRVHYLDLCMDTRREQILRIKQVVRSGMLDRHDLSDNEKDAVVNWVIENQEYLTDLSLRTVVKAADLAVSHPAQWLDIAEFTLLSHKGRIAKAQAAKAA